jgi:hypothetical protein
VSRKSRETWIRKLTAAAEALQKNDSRAPHDNPSAPIADNGASNGGDDWQESYSELPSPIASFSMENPYARARAATEDGRRSSATADVVFTHSISDMIVL